MTYARAGTFGGTVGASDEVVVLVADGANANLTGSTAETSMKSTTITGGTMGANGKIVCYFVYKVGGTNNGKTIRVKFGGVTLISRAEGTTEVNAHHMFIQIWNRNAQNSQYFIIHSYAQQLAPEDGTNTSVSQAALINTAAIDTSVNRTLEITGQLINSADSIDIRGFYVERITPP